MLSPKDSPRGKLLSQYVLVRITRLDRVDLGLFDYDRNNTLYFFALNSDEQIYMRYGGRDSESPDTYLNLNSLELALAQGLELHEQYKAGQLKKTERPHPLFAREIPLLVERTIARGSCVECHLVGDFQNLHREKDGTLDKITHLYRSPDLKNIGIQLDVPKGLVVKEAKGPAAEAGMKSGDRIAALNGTPVYTFGDLQHAYDKVNRKSANVHMTVDTAGVTRDLTIALAPRWWWSDQRYRQSSVDTRVYFDSKPLSADDKKKLGLPPDGFASEVTHVDAFAEIMKSHELRVGDIIIGADGVQTDPDAHTADLFLKLRKTPGDSVTLEVIRNGKRIQTALNTYRLSFRK